MQKIQNQDISDLTLPSSPIIGIITVESYQKINELWGQLSKLLNYGDKNVIEQLQKVQKQVWLNQDREQLDSQSSYDTTPNSPGTGSQSPRTPLRKQEQNKNEDKKETQQYSQEKQKKREYSYSDQSQHNEQESSSTDPKSTPQQYEEKHKKSKKDKKKKKKKHQKRASSNESTGYEEPKKKKKASRSTEKKKQWQPQTNFFIFMAVMRQEMKGCGLQANEISTVLAQKWKLLTWEQKQAFKITGDYQIQHRDENNYLQKIQQMVQSQLKRVGQALRNLNTLGKTQVDNDSTKKRDVKKSNKSNSSQETEKSLVEENSKEEKSNHQSQPDQQRNLEMKKQNNYSWL